MSTQHKVMPQRDARVGSGTRSNNIVLVFPLKLISLAEQQDILTQMHCSANFPPLLLLPKQAVLELAYYFYMEQPCVVCIV